MINNAVLKEFREGNPDNKDTVVFARYFVYDDEETGHEEYSKVITISRNGSATAFIKYWNNGYWFSKGLTI